MTPPRSHRYSQRVRDHRGLAVVDALLGAMMLMIIVFAGVVAVGELRAVARENAAEQAGNDTTQTDTEVAPAEPESTPEPAAEPLDIPWTPILAGTGGVLILVGAGVGGTHLLRRRQAAAAQRADLDARLAQARRTHVGITDAYADLRLDPIAAIDHLALWDIRDPLTAAFTYAHAKAGDLADLLNNASTTETSVGEYFDAVVAARVAWDRAVAHARLLGDTVLPEHDRNDLARARKLLTTAANSAATESERALAAARAGDILTNLKTILWPTETLTAIETVSRKALTPAPSTQL